MPFICLGGFNELWSKSERERATRLTSHLSQRSDNHSSKDCNFGIINYGSNTCGVQLDNMWMGKYLKAVNDHI